MKGTGIAFITEPNEIAGADYPRDGGEKSRITCYWGGGRRRRLALLFNKTSNWCVGGCLQRVTVGCWNGMGGWRFHFSNTPPWGGMWIITTWQHENQTSMLTLLELLFLTLGSDLTYFYKNLLCFLIEVRLTFARNMCFFVPAERNGTKPLKHSCSVGAHPLCGCECVAVTSASEWCQQLWSHGRC